MLDDKLDDFEDCNNDIDDSQPMNPPSILRQQTIVPTINKTIDRQHKVLVSIKLHIPNNRDAQKKLCNMNYVVCLKR